MQNLIGVIKSIVIVAVLVVVMGFGVVLIRNYISDNPSVDEPVDAVEVEDIILNETNIVF